MNHELTFEAEVFELPAPESPHHRCDCAKCRSQHEREISVEDDEASEELFEGEFDEFLALEEDDEVLPGPEEGTTATTLTPEKTCWVQNVLNRAEAESLVTDGIFGPLTRGAVQRFQARHRLLIDGIVGKQTETALIQTGLNTIAQASLLPINGVMDLRTQQEIRRFQAQQRLVVDGIVGPQTRGAMIRALGGRVCPARAVQPTIPPPKPTPRPPTPTPTPLLPLPFPFPPSFPLLFPDPPPPPKPPAGQSCPVAGRGNSIVSVHPRFVPVEGIGVNGSFTTHASASIVTDHSTGSCALLVDARIATAIASKVGPFGSFVATVNGTPLRRTPLLHGSEPYASNRLTMSVVGEATVTLPPGEIRSLKVDITTGYRLRGPEGLRVESATDEVTVI